MENELEQKIAEALQNPKNMGALDDADAMGTAGNAECGEMLRMWVKFKEERGKRVIDRATFQSFGCETAIAVASMAADLIRGKTVDEALAMSGQELAKDLGPLPPMKIHCSQLVESALRSALTGKAPANPQIASGPTLMDSMAKAAGEGEKRVVIITPGTKKQ